MMMMMPVSPCFHAADDEDADEDARVSYVVTRHTPFRAGVDRWMVALSSCRLFEDGTSQHARSCWRRPIEDGGTPLVHARGRRHTPQREACRLGWDCVINVTILAKGKTIYQLVLRITQWGEKRKSRETRRSQNP